MISPHVGKRYRNTKSGFVGEMQAIDGHRAMLKNEAGHTHWFAFVELEEVSCTTPPCTPPLQTDTSLETD